MNKEALKSKLISIQEITILELSEKVEMQHSMVDIDEDDTMDPEDFSHQYESGEMEQIMKSQLANAKRGLKILNDIDFSEKTKIEPGAFVQTNKFNFFIGFSTVPFDVDDTHIIGISTYSPIYTSMENKKVGDSYSFNGVDYQIEKIN
jgi:hypothetical protein